MELKLGDAVTCTLRARLDYCIVTEVGKRRRPPQYVIKSIRDGWETSLPINSPEDWWGKYIFKDVEEAIKDFERRIEDELQNWIDKNLRSKDELFDSFVTTWWGIDKMTEFDNPITENNVRLRLRKREVFLNVMQEWFQWRPEDRGVRLL